MGILGILHRKNQRRAKSTLSKDFRWWKDITSRENRQSITIQYPQSSLLGWLVADPESRIYASMAKTCGIGESVADQREHR